MNKNFDGERVLFIDINKMKFNIRILHTLDRYGTSIVRGRTFDESYVYLNKEIKFLKIFKVAFRYRASEKKASLDLYKPPGYRLLRFTEFFFSKRTNERVFEALVSEVHFDYFQSLDERRYWKARWIYTKLVLQFVIAIFSQINLSVLSGFKEIVLHILK